MTVFESKCNSVNNTLDKTQQELHKAAIHWWNQRDFCENQSQGVPSPTVGFLSYLWL